METKILKVHDDGDLTVQKGTAKFVVTTEGQVFKQIPKPQVPKFKLPKARRIRHPACHGASLKRKGVFRTKKGRVTILSSRKISRRSRRIY